MTERDEGNDGVDVSLIRWFLSLSPAERLRVLQDTVNAISLFLLNSPSASSCLQ